MNNSGRTSIYPLYSLSFILCQGISGFSVLFSVCQGFVWDGISQPIQQLEMKLVALARTWSRISNPTRQRIKNQRVYFADKGLSSQSYGFSISHIRM